MTSFKDTMLESTRNNSEELKILDQRLRRLKDAIVKIVLKALQNQLGLTGEEVLKFLHSELDL